MLAAAGTALTVGLAGCGGDGSSDGGDGGDSTPTDDGSMDETPSETTTTETQTATATEAMDGASGSITEVPDAIDSFLQDANGYDGTMVDATGQSSVTVAVGGGGFAFDPAAVRIDSSTTVDFEWMGGNHNVASTQESESDFTSGNPTGDEDTTFSQSFDNTGVQLYVCDVHAGSGMLGAIEVVQA